MIHISVILFNKPVFNTAVSDIIVRESVTDETWAEYVLRRGEQRRRRSTSWAFVPSTMSVKVLSSTILSTPPTRQQVIYLNTRVCFLLRHSTI